jgi:uncharacterized protein (DUF2461 family)
MADTAFFCPDVFIFLRQLKRNNNREWFAKNKARYQTSIRRSRRLPGSPCSYPDIHI